MPFGVKHGNISLKKQIAKQFLSQKNHNPRLFWGLFWHRNIFTYTLEKWLYWTVYARVLPVYKVASKSMLYDAEIVRHICQIGLTIFMHICHLK